MYICICQFLGCEEKIVVHFHRLRKCETTRTRTCLDPSPCRSFTFSDARAAACMEIGMETRRAEHGTLPCGGIDSAEIFAGSVFPVGSASHGLVSAELMCHAGVMSGWPNPFFPVMQPRHLSPPVASEVDIYPPELKPRFACISADRTHPCRCQRVQTSGSQNDPQLIAGNVALMARHIHINHICC